MNLVDLKTIFLTVINYTPQIILLLVIATFCFGIFAGIRCYYLFSYLKKYHYKKWRIFHPPLPPNIITGNIRAIKGLRYIFNDDDTKDETILKYKDSARFWLKLAFGHLIGTIIWSVITILIYKYVIP